MYTAEAKSKPSNVLQRTSNAPFFQAEESRESFFGSKSESSEPFFSAAAPPIQAKCDTCEQEEKVQKKEEQEEQISPEIQPKLSIGAPDDPYEKQADAVADQVVQRLAQPAPPAPVTTTASNIQLQHAAAPEELLQEKPEDMEHAEESIQMKPVFDSVAPPPEDNTVQRMCAECEAEGEVQKKEEQEEQISPEIQPKLSIGAPDDAYEKQADAVADQVVQRLAQPARPAPVTTTASNIQLQPAAAQEELLQEKPEDMEQAEESIQMKPVFDSAVPPPEDNTVQRMCAECEAEESEPIQRKENSSETTASPDLSSRLQSSRGGGSTLPDETKTQMESAMGADFSDVRVHTGSEAADMSQGIHAQAFTHGSDIYFNEGKYDPGSTDGQRLLAHELTHTVQQGGGDLDRVSNKTLTDSIIQRQVTGSIRDAELIFADANNAAFQRSPATLPQLTSPLLPGIYNLEIQGEYGVQAIIIISRPGGTVRLHVERASPEATLAARRVRRSGGRIYLQVFSNTSEAPTTPEQSAEDQIVPGITGEGETTGETGSEGGGQQGDGTPQDPLLAEAYQIARELNVGEISETPQDNEAFLAALREIEDPEERRRVLRDFFEYYRAIHSQPEQEPGEGAASETPVADAFRRFRNMTPAEREILLTNQALRRPDADAPPVIDEATRVSLNLDAEQNQQTNSQVSDLNQFLGQLDRGITDPARIEELEREGGIQQFPAEFSYFLNEIVMFKGLLAGASSQSEEIRQVSGQLLVELNALLERIRTELMWLLAQQVAITVAVIMTEGMAAPAVALWIRRLNNLRRLISNAQRAFAVYEQIRGIIQSIQALHARYMAFRQQIDTRIEQLRRLEAALNQLETPESVEAEVERLREDLTARFEQEMGEGGHLAQLLESFYIPPETSNEELLEIMLRIPRGLDDLERMSQFYGQIRDSNNPQNTIALGAIAVRAGAHLYPLVGFLAAKIAEALPGIVPERSLSERLARFIERVGTRMSRRGRREQNQGFFARLRGNRFEYDQSGLNSHLSWGRTRLLAIINQDEPSGHWARVWFRFTLRSRIRELNAEARSRRTRGRPRTRRGRPPAAWQDVPLPPFRVRIPLWQPRNRLIATLQLNPGTRLEVDRLTMDDFRGTGIPYVTSSERRKRAIRDFLKEKGYEFTALGSDRGKHIRLAGHTPAASERRPYLQLEGDYIKRDSRLVITRTSHLPRFLGRTADNTSQLPEGYYMETGSGSASVRKKRNVGESLPSLGFNDQERLQMGAVGGRRIERSRPRGRGLLPPRMERYNFQNVVDNMFVNQTQPRAGMNVQGHNRAWWLSHIQSNSQLQQRPTQVSGTLGFVRNARFFRDRLGSRPLPEYRRGDNKGHLVAKNFEGDDSYANLIPMAGSINLAGGAWRRIELDIAAAFNNRVLLVRDRQIQVTITIRYANRSTRRPSSFQFGWQEIGGGRPPISHPPRSRITND